MSVTVIDEIIEDLNKYDGEIESSDYPVDESIIKAVEHAWKKAKRKPEKAKKILAKKLHVKEV